MRLTSRFLAMAFVVLAAFWFTAENANEMVLVDLVLFRLRVSLPLLVFGSVLGGMGLALVVGWRADRKAMRRVTHAEEPMLKESPDLFDAGLQEFEPQERDPAEWH